MCLKNIFCQWEKQKYFFNITPYISLLVKHPHLEGELLLSKYAVF